MILRGMTWRHPRGHDPMVACSAIWAERTGVQITWDQRSLQDFESYPVQDLARAYDLIVIDHPHVGQITAEGCLLPLDQPGREGALAALAAGSVGASFDSYRWQGRLWGLPIDAAAQVLAWRPDLLPAPPQGWGPLRDLARAGRVLLPLRPPHSLMAFFTLAGNLGTPCATVPPLIGAEAGARAYDLLAELAALVDPACAGMDPIAVFEAMAAEGSAIACTPLAYGYVSYARTGFRPHRLAFADIAPAGALGPVGSALGGTGIAVSAFAPDPRAACDAAFWLASGAVQRGPYAAGGGQPGHGEAWEDAAVNAATHDFYRATRATLQGSWLRPRHEGYMPFQHAAAERLTAALMAREPAAPVIAELNALFAASFPG